MTGFSREQLRKLARARKRPTHQKLGQLPETLVCWLIDFYRRHEDENILDKAIESRTGRNIPMENSAYLNQHYGQVALQILKPGGDARNRRDYTKTLSTTLVDEIESVTGPGYRMRISALGAGAEIPEHVDDPDQLRVIALLEGRQNFTLRAKSEEIALNMQPGEVWYVNTAWPHKVHNPGKRTRLAVLIDLADYDFEKEFIETAP